MNSTKNIPTRARQFARKTSLSLLALLSVMLATVSSQAQTIRFERPAPLRLTVSVNTTNTGTITNFANIGTVVSGVTLSVSNLPANCGYDIATNGVSAGTSVNITNDWGVTLTINSTNIPQGEHTFWLVAEGDATNRFPFTLQSCYIWNGAGQTNTINWTNNLAWVGNNNPTTNSANDVFFGTLGAQTNRFTTGNNLSFTNITVGHDITVGSVRFGQAYFTSPGAAVYHHVNLGGRSLNITGAKGFSLLRDYIAEYDADDRKTGVFISGGNASRLSITNLNANIANLLDNGGSGDSFLVMTNIGTFATLVNRIGFGDFQLYPNYFEMNKDADGLGGIPRRFVNSVILARTNFITAGFKDPNNYTNSFTRAHAIMWLNGETSGNGSSTINQLWFGLTNRILADSVCFVGANHASGNSGFARFAIAYDANATAVFRNTNGTSRMSVLSVSDGGGTNDAASNIKANIDFATLITPSVRTATVDIFADRFYVARDRAAIAEGNTVNYEGTVQFGRGTVDVNTAVLGYQEHQVRRNAASPQLGYCRGILTVTNAGTFKVNGQLTLGYTADTNALADAQQYNTSGRVTVNGATMIASNIVVDGGPRNYSHTEGFDRADSITVIAANLIVSNSIGGPGSPASQPVHSFTTDRGTNTFLIASGRTNLFCRNLSTPGVSASIIRVGGLTGVGSYPATIPIISYENASSPFLQADVTPVTNLVVGLNGYLLNNTVDKVIELYLTTNAPKTLLWTGSISTNWDNSTFNWVTMPGGVATNFSTGDSVVFDDSSTATNVFVSATVVPSQSTVGITYSNVVKQYTLSGGLVAGTSLMRKVGAGGLIVEATKQGPVQVFSGTLNVAVSGSVGLVTLATNTALNNFGYINGGLTSTGAVTMAAGSYLTGPTILAAGWLDNSGLMATFPGGFSLDLQTQVMVTNQTVGMIAIGSGQTDIRTNQVVANFGTISNLTGRITIAGLMYGTGSVIDRDGGIPGGYGNIPGNDGRIEVRNPYGILSPGAAPSGSIGTMFSNTRFDLSTVNAGGWSTLLIEVDKSNAQTNDMLSADMWNNLQGRIIMSNLNPGMPFADGDSFLILSNNNGLTTFNVCDTAGDSPLMVPSIPGPGLQWDLSQIRGYGIIKVKATPMVWRGNVDTNWDSGITANWISGQTFTNNNGALFDDTAVNYNVWLTNVVAPSGYTITTNGGVFETNGSPSSPGIVVNNTNDYTIGGPGCIDGFSGLLKMGPGTLTILNMSNRFTEAVIINQGTLSLSVFTNSFGTNNATFGSPIGVPALNPRAPATSERLIFNGSTFRYTGGLAASGNGFTIGVNGATVDITNAATSLRIGGTVRGDSSLTKIGAGTLGLANGANFFTNLNVNAGMVRLENGAAGQGSIFLNGGSLGLTNATITNAINFTVNSGIDATNISVFGGPWNGSGNASLTNRASLLAWTANLAGYSGDITFIGNGTNRFNNATNSNTTLGSAGTVFDLGAGSARLENHNGAALTYDLGGLAGGAGSVLAGRSSNTLVGASSTIYSIGAKGVNTTFGGTIVDGSGNGTVAVVKVGGGILALNGVNTYTGTTTVSNGTLGGTGSVVSVVTVTSGGTFAPGNSVGTFTVSNNATLGGTTLLELNPVTSDLLRVTGTLTGGGTLTVTNIGSTLTNGTVFQLFSQPASGFTATNLPAGYVWNNNIAANGSITVVSGGIAVVNTTPTNITSSVSGNQLTLSWPSDRTGWTLQTQTNLLSVGLTPATNTWFGVAGSAATNTVVMTIDPTQPTVFYRLVYP